jgi:hypothetical protein
MADGEKKIYMSTTDVIPEAPQRPVRASQMAWISSQRSIVDARDQLADWARRHGCDAVVGVRIVPTSGVRVVEWIIYGTAITWES